MNSGYLSILKKFLEKWEGFSPSPYWDTNRWSWGYGTQAPGATGTITRDEAFTELKDHAASDKQYLQSIISRNLTPNQWAALLSFSYNTGQGNADNLADNINSGNDAALATQWSKYIYAGGVVNDTLVKRRAAELQLWHS